MRMLKPLLRSALLVLVLAGVALPAVADDTAATAKTAALLDHLDAGDFQAATADFNPQMQAALGVPQLQAVQRQLEAAGTVTSREPARITQRDGVTLVVVRIHRQHASLDARVAIDANGQVAGLYFTPVASGS